MKDDWLTVPAFPRYEVNGDCEVRNRETKRLMTVSDKGCVHLRGDAGDSNRSVRKLRRLAVGEGHIVTVSKGAEIRRFATKRAAVNFLAKETFYSASVMWRQFKAGATEIYGWQVEYVV